MKVKLAEFNSEKCNFSYRSQIYKIKKSYYMNLYKYPSRSTQMILNYKPVCTHKCHIPDKCKKEKVTICDYQTNKQFSKMCDI